MKRVGPKPCCACGCGQRVKFWKCRYASMACVPHALRVETGRRARLAYTRQQRIVRWRGELQRLRALPMITGEDLAATFDWVAKAGYQSGYQVGLRRGSARTQEGA